ncbi:RidA family protein [Streptomyces sp. NPDC002514]|uniref:RidA family protein n=1 Tax=unclassified Streptomyces TaxID=2593676 RepID=UPI0036A632DA
MSAIDAFRFGISAETDFGYSQAIRSGDLIHASGQLSFDEAGEFRHADDFAAQLKLTYAAMDRILDHYGVTRKQIVSQTVYLVDLRQHATAIAEGNMAYFGDHWPASTVLGISELTLPGQLVEIAFVVDTKLPA